MIRGAAAISSDPVAQAAARAILEGGASAVDAIIGGFLAAAGDAPGALLSPAVALVAGVGVGAGARAFDGRSAQPGKGSARPRGFVDAAAIPDAARFAAPRSLSMLALLHGYHGRAKLRELARYGVIAATQKGARRRAELLSSVGTSGVLALRERDVARALLARGGVVAGGLLSEADINDGRPIELDARASAVADGATVYESPWEPGDDRGGAECILACDARGIIAALSYCPAREGVEISELELLVGLDAVPVQRGVPRVAPGTPLGAPAPIAIVSRPPGFLLALALPGRASIEPRSLGSLSQGESLEVALDDVRRRMNTPAAIAVLRSARDARTVFVSSSDEAPTKISDPALSEG